MNRVKKQTLGRLNDKFDLSEAIFTPGFTKELGFETMDSVRNSAHNTNTTKRFRCGEDARTPEKSGLQVTGISYSW